MRPERQVLLDWIKPERQSPEELKYMKLLEAGDYEIYGEKLNSILLEAREVFMRTGLSSMLRSGDLIVGIYTAAGDTVCASCGTFIHMVVAQLPIKFAIHNWLHDPTVGIKEGDVFYCNEALYGGIHNPDQIAFMPVFHDGKLIAWTTAAVHQPETGGVHPGGMSPTSKSRYWEGMRLPPIRIGENYQLRNDMLEMFTNFISRAPRMQEIDVRARVTACDRARLRVQELARDKGNNFLRGLFRSILTRGEEATRKRISNWNDGIYRVVLFQDTAGIDETLIRVCVTLRKQEDRLLFDLSGTSPEHDAGSHNAFAHHVPAFAAVYFFHHVFHDLPISAGCFAPMEWMVPEGCVLNAGDDAAVANSPSIGTGPLNAMYLLFAKLAFDSPERSSIAGGIGGGSGCFIAGVNQYGVPMSDMLSFAQNTEGQGARTDRDGMDAHGFVYTPVGRAPNVEDVEGHLPVLHLFQKLRRDSCGFGKYRGGAGTMSLYTIHHVPRMSYTSQGRGTRVRISQGLFGGYPPGAKIGFELRNTDFWQKMRRGDKNPPTNEEQLMIARPIKGDYIFEHNTRPPRNVSNGDIFMIVSGGGVGYGDVLERDPTKVVNDLRQQIISHWTVEHVYRVAYDPETLEVDYAKTAELRRKESEMRKVRGKRYEEFEKEWSLKRPPDAALKHYGSWPDAKPVREILRV